MAYELQGKKLSLQAPNSDYSAKQYLAVDADTTAAGVKMVLQATAGGRVLGILQDKPTANQVGQVQIDGISKAVCGSAGATAGDALMVDTSSMLTTATTGKRIIGIALMTAVSGDVFPVLLTPGANVA